MADQSGNYMDNAKDEALAADQTGSTGTIPRTRIIVGIRQLGKLLTIGCVVVAVYVLGFHRPSNAAQPPKQQPFRNPVAQRQEMIRELSEIKTLLKQQNQLLRSIHQQNAQSKAKTP